VGIEVTGSPGTDGEVAMSEVNLALPDSSSDTIGNVLKNGTVFLHNFGTDNTFLGSGAGNLTMTGSFNTAVGKQSLGSNTTGLSNTALGRNTLTANTTGFSNVAVGQGAMEANTTGNFNTVVGAGALPANTTGFQNTAIGHVALAANTIGENNTALGFFALNDNTEGDANVAVGSAALAANTTGGANVALGTASLEANMTGGANVALGQGALADNTSGGLNIAIGFLAGSNLTTGSNNIAIDHDGVAGESATTRIGDSQTRAFIAGIRGVTTGVADGIAVLIDSTGQLGTISSSRRFKTDIHDMKDASSKILQLRPVTFHYKADIDPSGTEQYGLIAEEVAEVMPELVAHDKSGQIESVKYHLLATLLLNEVQKQQKMIAAQADLLQEQTEALVSLQTRLDAVETALPVSSGRALESSGAPENGCKQGAC
jgi:hypothetical protein